MRHQIASVSIVACLLVCILLATCSSDSTPSGTTYYVDVNHAQAMDSANHGSVEKPWKTIQYALRKLQMGDTLFIRGGIYKEQTFATTNSGTEQAPITVKAYPGEQVVWRAGGTTDNMWHIARGQHWIIEDLILEGRLILGNSLSEIAEYITIRDCTFRDNTLSGIRSYYARHLLVEDCHFVNIRSGQSGDDAHGIIVNKWGDDITIRNNRFEDIGADGIHLGAQGSNIGQVIIENNEFFISGQRSPVGENGVDIKGVQGPIVISGNTFHGFRRTVEGQDADGALGEALALHASWKGGPTAQNVTIEKNLFYDNSIHLWISQGSHDVVVRNNIFRDTYNGDALGLGIFVHDATDVEIVHNTFYNNKKHILSNNERATICVLKNNIFWRGGFEMPSSGTLLKWDADHNAWSEIRGGIPTILHGSHDVSSTDLQLDESLRPSQGSPLVDAGTNVGVTDDFANEMRSDGFPGLGAFECEYAFRIFLPVIRQSSLQKKGL